MEPNMGDLVGYSDETGMVSFIGSSSPGGIQVEAAAGPGMQPADRARILLSQYAPLFGEDHPDLNLQLISSLQQRPGQQSLRYQQTYQGIPILAAELILNLTPQGGIRSLSGELSPNLNLSVIPSINPDQAGQQVRDLLSRSYQTTGDQLVLSDPALWIFDERLIAPSTRPAELVWRFEVSIPGQPVNELVLVNAQTGAISLHFNQIDTGWNSAGSNDLLTSFDQELLFPDLLSWFSGTKQTPPPTSEGQTSTSLPPDRIEIYQGTGQSADISTPYLETLAIIAYDSYDVPLPGVEITFSAPDPAFPSVSFDFSGPSQITAITDESGIATTPLLYANQLAGTFVIIASTAGYEPTLAFELENTDGPYWFVAPTGNDAENDCRSPETACASVQGVLARPEFLDGDTILIAEGVFSEEGEAVVFVENDVNLRGGWNIDFTEQVGYSTIDGENERPGILTNFLLDRRFVLMFENLIATNGGPEGVQRGNLAIYNADGLIENCILSNGAGSGLSLIGSAMTLDNIEVNNNAQYGITTNQMTHQGTIAVSNSAIYHNLNTGIYISNSNMTIENTTISGNGQEVVYGGGIYFEYSTVPKFLSLNNVTVTGNIAGNGGGIFASDPISMQNTLIANNFTEAGYPSDCWGVVVSNGYNIIGYSTSSCSITPTTGDQLNVDFELAPLADYGGQTPTHALLLSGPAIDQGSLEIPGETSNACPPTDQRDQSRPFDGDEDGSAICDVGAYEYHGAEVNPAYIHPINGQSIIFNTGESYTDAFQVIILGPFGGEVAGIPVTFSAPETGPGGEFETGPAVTVLTDGQGIASSGLFSTNSDDGSYVIEVEIEGLTEMFEFEVRNVSAYLSTYEMDHRYDDYLPGDFLCDQHNLPCTNGKNLHADSAHQFALEVYEFFLEQHGRDSFDNQGMEIVSSVHYAFAYSDSFWNGSQVVYGDADDFPLADDFVAHELTHGFTANSSNLFYYYQSGAISESFSDLWGEAFDQLNDRGLDDTAYLWLIGEDLNGGARRLMSNPTLFDHPDRITSPFYHLGDWEDLTETPFDNGGVHTNSGVNNKAVYLLVSGDNFNGYTVSGIGWAKTMAIYYLAQTALLTSGADYGNLYFALQQACTELIGGAEGVTATDCVQVQRALDAVEMNQQPVSNFNPDVSLCPENLLLSSLFYDSFETGTAGWVFSSSSEAGSKWALASGYAAGGDHQIEISDNGDPAILRAAISEHIFIPEDSQSYLHFSHSFGFNYFDDPNGTRIYLDGGILQFQVGDSVWQDAAPLFDAGVGYNGLVSTESDSELAGSQAFVSDSHGYISSRFNLTSLAGLVVRFRWLVKTDSNLANAAWHLDDVRIYRCDPVAPSAGPTGLEASDGEYSNRVALIWNEVSTASQYRIFRDLDPTGASMIEIGSTTALLFLDFSVDDLLVYHYWVSACNISGCSPVGSSDSGYADLGAAGMLFSDDFETGDFSLWSRYNDGGGFLYACKQAAINGIWGACVERGTNDKRKQLIDKTPINQTNFAARISFDINGLSMAEGERFRFMQGKMIALRPFFIVLRYLNGVYEIQLNTMRDDLTKTKSNWYLLTNAPHTIEVDWQAAGGIGTNDGFARLYIDDVLRQELYGLDNDTFFITNFTLGFTSRLDDKLIYGIFYIDDVATGNNGHIGPP